MDFNRHEKLREIRLHFVGIGGIGMSGIAELFLSRGHRITGSDLSDSRIVQRLRGLGARIEIGHRVENVQDADVVVISSAVRPDNPEVLEAKRLRLPVIPRAEMLGELMRGKIGVAVAGTHGKTTTTSMLASVFTEAGCDPTLVIGGIVDSLGGNARFGKGEFVVAEADESDGSFLNLPVTYSMVTNIDADHLDHYGDFKAVKQAFVDFVSKLPFYGVSVVCVDDPGVRACLGEFSKPFVTYGLSPDAGFLATQVQSTAKGWSFEVFNQIKPEEKKSLGVFEIHVPGKHNILNALGVIALSRQIGVPMEPIRAGLSKFPGVQRRFEIKWRDPDGRRLIVEDYGHHPAEVRATLDSARQVWPDGRVIVVFQPHRYSRTQHCMSDFGSSFAGADRVYLTDIYPAGEEPIKGVDSPALEREIRKNLSPAQSVEYAGGLEQAARKVLSMFQPGDLVLCLGAGSIHQLPAMLIRELG